MKTSDISQTALVRRYGLRGAKLFARLWFLPLYVLLVALAAVLPLVGPQIASGWRRLVLGGIAGFLIVVATSLLTRMHLEFLKAIERLEAEKRVP